MKLPTFILLFFAAFLTSCGTLYTPTSHTIVAPEKEGNIEVSGSFGPMGLESNAVYAVSKHIAITGEARYKYGHRKYSDIIEIERSNKTLGAGIAWYKSDGFMTWSVLGGFHLGDSNLDNVDLFSNEKFTTRASHRRYYIQPMLTYNIRSIQMTGSLQLAHSNVHIKNGDDPYWGGIDTYKFFTVEPAFTIRYRRKYIQPFLQTGGTFTNKYGLNTASFPPQGAFNFALGATVPIQTKH
jgi:hypothetical protein